jgi:dTDP-glucose 4,6-dehydratase
VKLLITGGCGFAGHHLVEHVLETTDWNVVVLDSLTYAGRTERLTDIEGYDPDRAETVWHDLRAPLPDHEALDDVTAVVHMAAESHVERSLWEPRHVVMNNVAATVNMLEWARARSLSHFVQISTDEVYGPAPFGHAHCEWEPHIPSNPYSASKSAQEAVAISYWRSFGVPVVITNTMNMYGERQHPEKFVPMLISCVLHGQAVTLHGRPPRPGRMEGWTPSARHWLHARNHADALCWLLKCSPVQYGEVGVDRPGRWHIAGEERTVLEMAEIVAAVLDRELVVKWEDYHSSRPGHDHRYALDSSKICAAGWEQPLSLEDSLERTIRWVVDHPRWLRA